MKSVIVIFALIGLAVGLPEKPAPYPAKGWKPQGARLELPKQYGVPKVAPENVEFTTLTNEYLAPATTVQNDEDVLRVQGLPRADAVSQFNNVNAQQQQIQAVKVRQPQVARIQMAPAPAFIGQPFLLSPLFAPQFAPTNGRLQERQFNQQQQQQQEFDSPKNDAQQLPPQAYGPPQNNNNEVPEATTVLPEVEVPRREEPNQPESIDEYDEDQADSDEPSIAVSNAEATGNLVQDTQQGQVGQYYILLPDNSLQKVRFATKQTNEDRQINGFSAQLR